MQKIIIDNCKYSIVISVLLINRFDPDVPFIKKWVYKEIHKDDFKYDDLSKIIESAITWDAVEKSTIIF